MALQKSKLKVGSIIYIDDRTPNAWRFDVPGYFKVTQIRNDCTNNGIVLNNWFFLEDKMLKRKDVHLEKVLRLRRWAVRLREKQI